MASSRARLPSTPPFPNLLAGDVDAKVFPFLHDYLKYLPDGLHSCPQCRTISGFFTSMQGLRPDLWKDPRLPAPLREMLNQRFPEGAFMSMVHSSCQSIVLVDLKAISEEAYLQEAHRIMWAVLSGPAYRAILSLLSPNMVLMGMDKRWNNFMQGADITSLGGTKNTHTLRLTAPPYLFHPAWLQFFAGNFEEMLRRANGRNPQVTLERTSLTETLFKLRWEA